MKPLTDRFLVAPERTPKQMRYSERLAFAVYAVATVVCVYLLIVAVLSFEAIK